MKRLRPRVGLPVRKHHRLADLKVDLSTRTQLERLPVALRQDGFDRHAGPIQLDPHQRADGMNV